MLLRTVSQAGFAGGIQRGGILATATIYDLPGFSRLVPRLEAMVALLFAETRRQIRR